MNFPSNRFSLSLAWGAVRRLEEQAREKLGTAVTDLSRFNWAINIDYFSRPSGSGLLELFPITCDCEHPGDYSHHIYICLNAEEIEEFERNFSDLIEKERLAAERYKAEVVQELEEELEKARETLEVLERKTNEITSGYMKQRLEFWWKELINSKNKRTIDENTERLLDTIDQIIFLVDSAPPPFSFSFCSSNYTSDYDSYSSNPLSNSFSDASVTSEKKSSSNLPKPSTGSTSETKNKPSSTTTLLPLNPSSEQPGQGAAKTTEKTSAPLLSEQPQPDKKTSLTNQKQKNIKEIQEKLEKNPSLSLDDDWKQEIEQSQSLESLETYQKSLLGRIEELNRTQSSQSYPLTHHVSSPNPKSWVGWVMGIIVLSLVGATRLLLWWKRKPRR